MEVLKLVDWYMSGTHGKVSPSNCVAHWTAPSYLFLNGIPLGTCALFHFYIISSSRWFITAIKHIHRGSKTLAQVRGRWRVRVTHHSTTLFPARFWIWTSKLHRSYFFKFPPFQLFWAGNPLSSVIMWHFLELVHWQWIWNWLCGLLKFWFEIIHPNKLYSFWLQGSQLCLLPICQ